MDIFLFCSTTKKLNKTEIINLNIEKQHQKTKNKNTFEFTNDNDFLANFIKYL